MDKCLSQLHSLLSHSKSFARLFSIKELAGCQTSEFVALVGLGVDVEPEKLGTFSQPFYGGMVGNAEPAFVRRLPEQ